MSFPDATFLMLTHLLWILHGPFSFRFPLAPPDSWSGAGFERGRVLRQLSAHSPCFLWSPCIPACATLDNFFFLAASQKKNSWKVKGGVDGKLHLKRSKDLPLILMSYGCMSFRLSKNKNKKHLQFDLH